MPKVRIRYTVEFDMVQEVEIDEEELKDLKNGDDLIKQELMEEHFDSNDFTYRGFDFESFKVIG